MIEYQVDIHLGSKVEGISHHGVMISKEGRQKTIDADMVVVAVGSLPNRKVIVDLEMEGNEISMDGKKIEVHLIGDCKEPRKILEAIHEGAEVALRI